MASGKKGNPSTTQKSRAEGDAAKARAVGGGLPSQPAEKPAGRSASTGGRATKASARSSANSRSSNSGKKTAR